MWIEKTLKGAKSYLHFSIFRQVATQDLLVFMTSLIILGSIFSLTGGAWFFASQLFFFAIFLTSITFVCFTFIGVLRSNAISFLALLTSATAFVALALANYSPVVFGGQDPGYYSAFSKILSKALGSPFSSSPFETGAGDPNATVPSTNTLEGKTEIQFYPLLPTFTAALDGVFGELSYPVVSIVSALLVVAFLLRLFKGKYDLASVGLSVLWLFIPATLWFSRTPASEVMSVPLLALVLALPTFKITSPKKYTFIVFTLCFGLMLSRANPLLLLLVLVVATHHLIEQRLIIGKAKSFIWALVATTSAAFFSGVCYYIFLPDFFKIIFIDIYGPSVHRVTAIAIIAIIGISLIFALKMYLGKKNQFLFTITRATYNLTIFAVALLLFGVSNFLVLFTDSWGEYSPDIFQIGSSLIERFDKTSFAFMVTSFGLVFLMFRLDSTSNQSLLLTILAASLIFAIVRNPGIPISYFYERYWWSEIGLIILFLLTSSAANKIGRNVYTKWLLLLTMITIATNIVAFDLRISETTEASSDKDFKRILRVLEAEDPAIVAYSKSEDIWWVSSVVVPLRYYYGVKIDIDSNPATKEVSDILFMSQKPCEPKLLVSNLSLEVPRLQKFAGWGVGFTPVYLCNRSK